MAEVEEHQLAIVSANGIGRRYDLGPECNLAAAGGGRAAVRCRVFDYELVDLGSGATTRIDLPADVKQKIVGAYGFAISAIGRHWAQTIANGNHYFFYEHWNPVTNAFPPRMPSLRQTLDLDDPNGVVSLCSPVARPKAPYARQDSGSSFPSPTKQLQRTGRWHVYFPGRDKQGRPGRTRLFAWRCGHRRPILVSTCRDLPRGCSDFDTRQNFVAWKVPGGVRVMDLANGRRTLFRGRFGQPVIGRGKHVYAVGAQRANGKYPLLVKQM